jgi:hypothetical protein
MAAKPTSGVIPTNETPDADEPVHPLTVPRRRIGNSFQLEATESTGGQTPESQNPGRTGKCVLQSSPMEGEIRAFFEGGRGTDNARFCSIQDGSFGMAPRGRPEAKRDGHADHEQSSKEEISLAL